MTEEQLAEIEQRWADNEVTMQTINDFNLLLAEVRKLQENLHYEETCHAEAQEEVRRLNRMVDKSCKLIIDLIKVPVPRGDGLCPFSIGRMPDCFDECNNQFADCWRKYLESEAAGNG